MAAITKTDVPTPSALSSLKVLDLSQQFSSYCGKLFADMGADVILIEPPVSGSALRRDSPSFSGMEDPLGIPFFYFNSGKRGITLNLDTPAGADIFRRLVSDCDLVIEDTVPGTMERRGLDYKSLSELNPGLVMTSVTAFGQSGPYSRFAADDLTLLALGGFLNLMGYPDTAPTQAYGNQSYSMASLFAAVGSMLAVLQAQNTGAGQHVDVAVQECVVMALENTAQFYDLEGKVRTRFGDEQRQAGTGLFECSDGHVYLFAGGMAAIRFWPNLVDWLRDEKVTSADVLDRPEWSDMAFLNSEEAKVRFGEIFAAFACTRTKEELYRHGQERRVPICPISTAADIVANRQLAYREFFASVAHPGTGEPLQVPGAPYRLSRTPWRLARTAPKLGEHNEEVYRALQISWPQLGEMSLEGTI